MGVHIVVVGIMGVCNIGVIVGMYRGKVEAAVGDDRTCMISFEHSVK
jgi:hypothetical protein